MTRVKICGITNGHDAFAACEAGADAIGFVFANEAKARNRYIDPDAARRIAEALPPFVCRVAVCVNEPLNRLKEYLEFVDYVQLCGEEAPADCAPLAGRVIKAFHVGTGFDVHAMPAYPAAAYLLDACVPGARGGTGAACNWDLASQAVALDRPINLAGGLTPENVAEAVRRVQPYAVDVSGGVESAPGKKDHEKIRRFILHAKLPAA